jgi:hypothetical protein
MIRDWGDVLTNPALGLYGAIVVGPAGATYTDPVTGADASKAASWSVDVHPTVGPAYRDAALFFQDADAGIGTHRMPYTRHVEGVAGINYGSAPLRDRLVTNPNPAQVFSSGVHGDPATPVIRANPGDLVAVHVLAPSSAQEQVFSIEGHSWGVEPGRPGTPAVSSQHFGGLTAATVAVYAQQPGDYVYGDHRQPYTEAGMWGIFRVQPCDENHQGRALSALGSGCGAAGGSSSALVAVILLLPFLAAPVLVDRRRRSGDRC